MVIDQVRRTNARALASSVGGGARFAERVGMSRQQASSIIGARPTKAIGGTLARRIEAAFKKPMGWLDEDHNTPSTQSNNDWIDVPALSGLLAGEVAAADIVRSMQVAREWLRQLKPSAFEHIALMRMYGDAMTPTLDDGDLLLVDRGQLTLADAGVFVFMDGDVFHVRRIQRRIDGSITVICDNTARYSSETMPASERSKLAVVGRVLGTLRHLGT